MPLEQPQIRVSLGGVPVPGVTALQVESVGYFAASRFQVTFALGAGGYDLAYFTALGQQEIIIQVALDGLGFVPILTGQIDNIRCDLAQNTVTLCGRDLACLLIDSEIAESFVNQTASQIARSLAQRFNLVPDVTPTSAKVGQYYELDHARSGLFLHSRAGTAWNLLTKLAIAEDFVLFVNGRTLYFGPLPVTQTMTVTRKNFSRLDFDIVTALPSAATVKSWNCRHKSVISQTAGIGEMTTLIRPNLSPAAAMREAQHHLAMLGRHGTILLGEMKLDLTLAPGMQIQMIGTGSPLDTVYAVATVNRRLHGKAGLVQIVNAYALN